VPGGHHLEFLSDNGGAYIVAPEESLSH
jgi:hypothetical protein